LKDKLPGYHREMMSITSRNTTESKPVKTLSPGNSLMPYLIAASFLLLVALAGWWFIFQPSEHEKLFAKHFVADPGLITPMSAGNNFIFYDGMVNYKSGEYARAISKWENLLVGNPSNDTINYFIGVAYLAKNQPTQAIVYFEVVTGIPESAFIDETWFYLGLANLKKGYLHQAREAIKRSEIDEARVVLQDLNKKMN
jgi:tetratricopeptide (TPR) repeat protein